MVWLIFLGLLPKNTFGEPSMAFLMSRLVKLFWKQCVNPVIGFEAHLFLACIVHEGIGRVISRHTRVKGKTNLAATFREICPEVPADANDCFNWKVSFWGAKISWSTRMLFSFFDLLWPALSLFFHSLIFFFFFPLFSPLWGSPLMQSKRLRRAGFLQPASAP